MEETPMMKIEKYSDQHHRMLLSLLTESLDSHSKGNKLSNTEMSGETTMVKLF